MQAVKEKKGYPRFQLKIFRVLILVGILPLVLISTIALRTVIQTRAKNISELQLQTIETASGRIEKYLEEKIDVFNLIVDLENKDISEVKKESLEFLIGKMKNEIEGINAISFIAKDGREIVKLSDVSSKDYFFLNNVSEREDFKKAISGEDYFGSTEFTLAGPIIHVASQIKNKRGEIIGAISAELNLNPVSDIIASTKIGNEGFVYLVDKNGSVIACSNKEFAKFGENMRYVALVSDVLAGNVRKGLTDEDRYVNQMGKEVVFAGKPINIAGWSILSEWPKEDAFLVVKDIMRQSFYVVATSLVLVVALSFFMARSVVRPIELLKKGLLEIGKGNFDFRIKIKTNDEIEELGEGLNNMTEDLKEVQRLREVEIRNKALAKSLEEEKKLSHEKDIFIETISHQLRTPISVLNWTLELLGREKNITEGSKKLVDNAKDSSRNLVSIVNDFVAASEFGLGGYEKSEFKLFDIRETAAAVFQDFKEKAKEKKIAFAFQASRRKLLVFAVPLAIKEVLRNLLDNAICYTKEGGRVEVSVKKGKEAVKCRVSDTGIGIPEGEQKFVFSQFFRASNSVEQKNVGTGLGLYIVKKIIDEHKGKIFFQSKLGKGTVFCFTLPSVNREEK